MMDLRELYQEMILDHNRRPRHFHVMPSANRVAQGHNPLCGDELMLYLKMEDGVIVDASFQGKGCAISTASASMLTDSVIGKTEQQAHVLFETMHQLLTGKIGLSIDIGKLAALAGVSEFPARVKCATLAWHTLVSALHNDRQMISTE